LSGHKDAACICQKYTDILYEWNLDYTGCDPLLIQYTGNNDESLDLEVDEIANEVNLADQFSYHETLIFSDGLHPRCYVNGCTITSEQK